MNIGGEEKRRKTCHDCFPDVQSFQLCNKFLPTVVASMCKQGVDEHHATIKSLEVEYAPKIRKHSPILSHRHFCAAESIHNSLQ